MSVYPDFPKIFPMRMGARRDVLQRKFRRFGGQVVHPNGEGKKHQPVEIKQVSQLYSVGEIGLGHRARLRHAPHSIHPAALARSQRAPSTTSSMFYKIQRTPARAFSVAKPLNNRTQCATAPARPALPQKSIAPISPGPKLTKRPHARVVLQSAARSGPSRAAPRRCPRPNAARWIARRPAWPTAWARCRAP